MLHQLISYIKFLLSSTNEHGVHSPFVFGLLTNCLYKKEQKPAFKELDNFRKALLSDKRSIEVKDYGAGSKVFKSNTRKVADIAKNAGISKKRARLLNKLTSYLEITTALELGTSLGMSSAAIAAGNPVRLTTIEGCPRTASIAQQYFEKFHLDNINPLVSSFEHALGHIGQADQSEEKTESVQGLSGDPEKLLHTKESSLDLVYFDGNHQKQATLEYFYQLLPLSHNDSLFIFDDIHWSSAMEEAWEEIKMHPKVKITIDSYFWGMVFFRREQEKEHFILRL